MVIRVPVNLDVTDNDIAESIGDEVQRGARSSKVNRAGRTIGGALGGSVGAALSDSISRAIGSVGSDVDLSGFTQDVNGRLRDAEGRFVAAGEQSSRGFARGLLSGGVIGAALASIFRDAGSQVDVSGFTRDVNGRLRDERGRFVAAGEESGRGFGLGLGRGLSGIETFGQLEFSAARLGASLAGLTGLITPVGGALGGVAAAAVALGGALGTAAGAAVSAGGVLASVGLAAGTTQIAMAGLSDAFDAQIAAQQELAATGEVSAATQEALTAAMDGLAPAAAALVSEVSALTPAWQAFQGSIQQTLFEGVAGQLQGLSDAVLPTLQTQLGGTASILNQAALAFADFAQSEQFVSQLDAILSGLNDTLAALIPGAAGVGGGLLAIFEAGTGPATDMARAISQIGQNFGTWAQGVAESGQLTAFLDQANVVLGDLLGIVGNVGSILVSVFGAGAATGAGLLDTFRDLTGQLAAFLQTAEAQSGLAQFFDLISQTGQTIGDLGSVIGPVFQGLFAVIGQLLPQVNALRDTLLPIAVVLGETIGQALSALAPIIGLVASLIVGLVQAIAPLITQIVGALGPAIASIAAMFQGSLSPALTGLIGLLQPLLGILLEVFGAQVVNAINLVVTVLGGLFDILGGLINFIVGVFTGDWDRAWSGIVQIFDGIVSILLGVVDFLWQSVQNLFLGGFDTVTAAVSRGWNSVVSFFSNGIRNAGARVARFVLDIRARFNRFRSVVSIAARLAWIRVISIFRSALSRVGSAVRNGINSVVNRFRDLRSRIRSAVSGFGSLLYNAGRNVIRGLVRGIRSMLGSVGGSMSQIAGRIRAYLPFSPARLGPLAGQGSPDNSGEAIAQMIADGLQQNVNLPARAMERALAPLAPTGSATRSVAEGARDAPVASGGVNIQQVFTGPTTSGGRLQEMEWNLRYATQARREVTAGVPTA